MVANFIFTSYSAISIYPFGSILNFSALTLTHLNYECPQIAQMNTDGVGEHR